PRESNPKALQPKESPMTANDPNVVRAVSPEAVRELAESGAICETCSGIHIPDVTSGILLVRLPRERRPPICNCPGCEICQPLRERRGSLKEKRGQRLTSKMR